MTRRRPRLALLKSRRLALDLGHAYDGGSIHVVQLVQALCAHGCEVDAFTRSESGENQPPIEPMPGFRVWPVAYEVCDTSDLFARDLVEGRSFVEGVLACPGFSAASFDAIQIHHWTSGVNLVSSLPEALPIAFTPHLLPTEKAHSNGFPLPGSVAEVEQELLSRADVTIAMSLAEEQSCRRLGARRVERIANGVSDSFFRLPLSNNPGTERIVRLGSVGRICVQKGADALLDAMERLLARGVNVSLDVVGPSYGEDGFEAEIRRRVLDRALSDRVRLLGPVSHEALPSIVAGWDVYLQPSRYESQGIALLEAMAAGRCIVATALPAVTEFLKEDAGHLVPTPPTGETIADAVVEAISCSTWRDRALAARHAAKAFRWTKATTKLLGCLVGTSDKRDWRDVGGARRTSQVLHEQGQAVALRIARDVPTAGIFLLGSAARGIARPGSDVDLLVLQHDRTNYEHDWRFTQSAPVDVRWESTASIYRMCEMPDDAFAETVAGHPLVDYLYGARALTPVEPELTGALALLERRRSSSEIRRLIAHRMLASADSEFDRALHLARRNLSADAQIRINTGAQLLLQAALVQVGWIIQGAKRRLEAASAYASGSVSVRRAVRFLSSAVGVDGVTYPLARRIVAARSRLRAEHLSCLERLGAPSADIEVARRHKQGVTDYYSPTMACGYLKGCVNHIRSLSGVPLMPSVYAKLLAVRIDAPAQAFLSCTDISGDVRRLWKYVMRPHDSKSLSEYATEGMRLSGEFARRE